MFTLVTVPASSSMISCVWFSRCVSPLSWRLSVESFRNCAKAASCILSDSPLRAMSVRISISFLNVQPDALYTVPRFSTEKKEVTASVSLFARSVSWALVLAALTCSRS